MIDLVRFQIATGPRSYTAPIRCANTRWRSVRSSSSDGRGGQWVSMEWPLTWGWTHRGRWMQTPCLITRMQRNTPSRARTWWVQGCYRRATKRGHTPVKLRRCRFSVLQPCSQSSSTATSRCSRIGSVCQQCQGICRWTSDWQEEAKQNNVMN